MRVKVLLCAENVIRDTKNDAISVINIIEGISAHGFPIAIPRLAILYILERDDTEPEAQTIQIRISNNDEQLVDHTIESTFSGRLRNRTIFDVNGLVITNPGNLKVALISDENEIAVYTVGIELLQETATRQDNDGPEVVEPN